MDVHEIDGASHTGVDHIRELKEIVLYPPARDRYKIFIIDEVHMLSTSAFNALLKTLEEPPPHAIFMFATTERHKIPPTILSRCQQFTFQTIPGKTLTQYLQTVMSKESIKASDGTLKRIVRASDGCVRDALSLLDQMVNLSGPEIRDDLVAELMGELPVSMIRELLHSALSGQREELWAGLGELSRQGTQMVLFYEGCLSLLREALNICLKGPTEQLLPAEMEALQTLTENHPYETILRAYNFLLKEQWIVARSEKPARSAELILLKLAEIPALVSFEEILRGERTLPNLPSAAVPSGSQLPPGESGSRSPGDPGGVQGFMAELESQHPALAGYLDHARVEVHSGTLQFIFPERSRLTCDRLNEPVNREKLLSIARKHLGDSISISCSVKEDAGDTLDRQARQDENVQLVLDFFQGTITGVQKAPRREDTDPPQEEE